MKLLSEFKAFLLKGNLITVAIAFVMGVSFAALLTSFVRDMITPIIGAVVGQSDFSNLTFTIHSSEFKYGAFITAILTFVSIAAAVFFFIVKPYEVYAARTKLSDDEPVSDEERRHQELLAAIRALNS